MKKQNCRIIAMVLLMLSIVWMVSGCASNTTTKSAAPAAQPAETKAAEPIILRWVSFRAANHSGVKSIQSVFCDEIKARTNGKVVIEYKGGPEVMSPSDVGMALQKGSIDFTDIYVGAYEGVVPGAGGLSLTQFTPQEERGTPKIFDFINKMHEDHGIKYLGRPEGQNSGYFYTYIKGKKATTIQEIGQLRIGTAAGAKDAVAGWGVDPTNVAVAENFEALQSGIVNAIAGQPLQGSISNGWNEMINYVIDHPYFQSTVVLLMNLEKWNAIPADLQKIITDVIIDGENKVMAQRDAGEEAYKKTITDGGAEFYKLPDDVAKWYLKQAYDCTWQSQIKKYPDIAPKLKELLSK